MNIGIIGAGSFGTAISILFGEKKFNVTLWAYEKEIAWEINEKRKNSLYLEGFSIPENVRATTSLEDAVIDKDFVISAIPTFIVRKLWGNIKNFLSEKTIIISTTKGIETETLMTISEIFRDILDQKFHKNLSFLSGPSFAREVAQKQPTAVSIASFNEETGKKVQDVFTTSFFRPYTTDDVTGVELGGALKNIIAIAAGIAVGLNLGENTLAALMTRGIWEIARLAVHKGATPLTLAGLSGTGDLILTCTGKLSRNRSVGVRIGKGEKLPDILKGMKMVAEGVWTTKSARELSKKLFVDMPITNEVYLILYEGKNPREAVYDLMARELKPEIDTHRII